MSGPEDLQPGALFEGMRILGRIGMGGAGRAYRVEGADGRTRVLEVLPAHLGQEGFAEEFLEDAATLTGFTHPGILRAEGFGQRDDELWLVSELPPGQPLPDVRRRGPCDLTRTVAVVKPVAAVLDYLHGQGIVHGALGPRLIHVGDDRVCLELGVDWILGRPWVRQPGRRDLMVGNPRYLCLERIMAQAAGPTCDVYALGLIAYEMLVGDTPFGRSGVMDEIVRKAEERFDAPPPELMDEATQAVVKRCLTAAPARRWPSATAFVAALEQPSSNA